MVDKEIFEKVSKELGIDELVVKCAYNSYWEFIRKKIADIPFHDDMTEDEYNKVRTNFNIPSLGKLNCTYERYKALQERYNKYKHLIEKHESNKESKTDVHRNCDDMQ